MATQIITSSLSVNTSDPANKKSTFELLLSVPNPPTIQEQPINRISQQTWIQSIKANTPIYQDISPTANTVNAIEGTELSWSILAGDASNLENPNDSSTLKYFWRKDDASMVSVNSLNNNKGSNTITITSEQCTPAISGEYVCEVSNQYGTVISDSFTLNVFNADNVSKFYTNLIQNGNGEGGLNTWDDGDNIKVLPFSDDITTRTNFGSFQLGGFITLKGLTDKPTNYEPEFRFSTSNHSSLFYPGYNIRKASETGFLIVDQKLIDESGIPPAFNKWLNFTYLAQIVANEDYTGNSPLAAFFPGTYWIDKYNKNEEIFGGLTQELTKGIPQLRTDTPTYFTRNNIEFKESGGDKSATFSQTINLEDLSDFINGNSYGVDNLESQFFAYVGAGITGYNVTLDTFEKGIITTKYYLTDVENWYDSLYVAKSPVFENGTPSINGNDLHAIVAIKDTLYGREVPNPKDSTIVNLAHTNARPIQVYNGVLDNPAPLLEYHKGDSVYGGGDARDYNYRSRVQYKFSNGIAAEDSTVIPTWHLSAGDLDENGVGINFALPTKAAVVGLDGNVVPGIWGTNQNNLEEPYDIRGRLKNTTTQKNKRLYFDNGQPAGIKTEFYEESYWKKSPKQIKMHVSCSLKFQASIDIVGPELSSIKGSNNYGRIDSTEGGSWYMQVALQKRASPTSPWVNHDGKIYGSSVQFNRNNFNDDGTIGDYNNVMGSYSEGTPFTANNPNDYGSATFPVDFEFNETIDYTNFPNSTDEWRVVLLSFQVAGVSIITKFKKLGTEYLARLDRPWAIVYKVPGTTGQRYNIELPVQERKKNELTKKDSGWIKESVALEWRINTIPLKFDVPNNADEQVKIYTWLHETIERADHLVSDVVYSDGTYRRDYIRHYFMAGTVTNVNNDHDNEEEYVDYLQGSGAQLDYKKPRLSIAILPAESYIKITAPEEEFDSVYELGIGGQKFNAKPNTNIEITPLVEDTTQIKIQFLNSTEAVLDSYIIDGPDAKDVWAIKEKVYFPLTLNPIFQFVNSAIYGGGNPITVFGQPYTHTKALAPWFTYNTRDIGFGMLELGINSLNVDGTFKSNPALGTVKDTNAKFLLNKYNFGPYGSTYPRLGDISIKGNTHRALYDHGAAAMFGVGKNMIIPANAKSAKITVTFTHNSPIYDTLKKLDSSELYGNIYDDSSKMGTQVNKKYFKLQEYGAPRCGITQMKFLVAPNSIETTGKHVTYSLPPKKFTVLGLQREKYAIPNYFNSAILKPFFNYDLVMPNNLPTPPQKPNPFILAKNLALYLSVPNNTNTAITIDKNPTKQPEPPVFGHGGGTEGGGRED